MVKESTFLMWQLFFAVLSVSSATQKQNESSQIQAACLKTCLCSSCQMSESPDLLTVQCSSVNLDDFVDLPFADKICSL